MKTIVPDGYKKTKVGVIPNDWQLYRTDKVLKRVRNSVDVIADEEYKQIEIRSHGKGIFYKETVSGKELGNKSVFWIEPDCFIVNIVFAWEQAVGKTTENEVGMIASHRFPMYKPQANKVDLDYLVYLFKSKRGKYLLELASPGGAGRNKTLGQGEFAELEIALPPFKEQQKIANILTTYDEAIVKQEELIKTKELQKKALMQKLLSGEVRFGSFNDKWNEIQVSQVFQNIGGTSLESEVIENGKYKFISIGNYSVDGRYIDNQQRVNLNKKTKDKLLYKDNLVMVLNDKTASGDLIGSTILINEDNTFIYNQRSERLICSNKIVPLYAWFKLNSKDFRKKIFSLSQGGTQIYINFPAVKKIKIKLPSLEEQAKIAEVLSLSDNEINLLKKELEELKLQKKALMQKLLTGQVRVKV